MKPTLAAVLSLGLLLAACDQPGPPPPSATTNPVPEAYRDTTGAAWKYSGPASALPLGISGDSPLFSTTVSASSSWGPIELNTSNGEKSAGDGHPITMNGVVYPYGLGLHAGAEISYSSTQATGVNCQLTAEVGVDDEVGDKGSVVFQVFADGNKLYDSGRLTGADGAKHLTVTIPSAKQVRLVVTNGGDDYYYDHADIGSPTVSCTQSSSPTSPTPQRILFGSNIDSPSGSTPANAAVGGGSNTYAVNIDGTGGRYLSHNKTEEMGPRVSPDGTKVVFSDYGDRNVELGYDTVDIYIENLDGTGRVRLTNSSTLDGSPTWSPDGQKIAFVRSIARDCRPCDPFTDIFTMNADGSQVTRLTTDLSSRSPDWSPDGTKIAYSSNLGMSFGNGENIYTINVDGTNQKQLTTDFVGFWPDWSPDGKQLLFSHSTKLFIDDLDLYVMDANGGNLRKVTNEEGYQDEAYPNWSPDGKQIVYEQDNGRFPGNGYYIINADGTGRRLVYGLPENPRLGKADWLFGRQ